MPIDFPEIVPLPKAAQIGGETTANFDLIRSMSSELTDEGWPDLRLKSLRMVNFGIHEYVEIDLTEHGSPMPVIALVGPNGSGKTTILNAIQILFYDFKGYNVDRIRTMMQQHLRNFMWMKPGEMLHADLEVSGLFELTESTDTGPRVTEYEVKITRDGVVSPHPEIVSYELNRFYHFARFDQELHLFQLKRDRWPLFQKLFSAVTGFKVEEDDAVFSAGEDIKMKKLMEEYVTGFKIVKPNEIILNKQCSAGERKIAKCFSTILNKDVQPRVILIDNVTDHIEIDRHLPRSQGQGRGPHCRRRSGPDEEGRAAHRRARHLQVLVHRPGPPFRRHDGQDRGACELLITAAKRAGEEKVTATKVGQSGEDGSSQNS